jgi:formylglycine-generating enzyme required for sulfatase activity
MLGNLWEWVDDRYLPYDLPARPGDGRRLPPEPAPSPEDTGLVARGGSYMNAAPLLRVSERYRTSPTNESRSTGIRVARALR